MVRIEQELLLKLTKKSKERNIYTHPLFLARDIFWQRLEYAFKYIQKYTKKEDVILDFGGGSGVFSKSLSSYFDNVSIIDLDTQEASNIKEHFSLNNVTIFNEDINNFKTDIKYDLIVATDVLEHFKNLNEPLDFFKKHMSDDAKLLVTLPTENSLYSFGRLLINKSKPKDHYHKSQEVIKFLLENGFELIQKEFIPKYLVSIPLFELAIFKLKR